MRLFLFCSAAIVTGQAESGNSECVGAAVEVAGGRCEACKAGWVAGLKVASRLLFESLDNHGHKVDPEKLPCEACKRVVKIDGFCTRCGMGFFRGQAYFSQLSYHLVQGKPQDPVKVSYAVCRKNVESGGWCDACGVGMIGEVAVELKEGFEDSLRAFQRIRKALGHIERCETCAAAMYSNGMCPKCRMEDQDGEPVARSSP